LCGLLFGFFASYEPNGASVTPVPSPFIGLFILHTIVSIGSGIFYLAKKYLRSQGMARNQFKFLILASSVLLVITPVTNFVVPNVFGNTFFTKLSPLYTLAFAGLIAYSMIKHRLLDFRLLVAKAFGYVLTIGLLAAVYTAAVFTVSSLLFSFEGITLTTQLLYTGSALLLGFTFQPMKKFFDKVSSRVFFQDSYDPQVFLDKLNRVLVSNIELEALLSKVAQMLNDTLKSEYTVFVIRETAYLDSRTIGSKNLALSKEEAQLLHSSVPTIRHRVIMADEMIESEENSELRKLLNNKNIAVLARLVTTLKYDVEGVGYLMLGPKKSGNTYTEQDTNLIRIIANELVIAIENALRFEEIEKFNATLQEKVDNATRQLRHTNDKLKQMDETKDEFISMASHQLRTPLTSVKGYLSMVLEGDAGDVPEMQQKLLNQAFVSSQRMVYLIADLLNVSRLRTGKFVIEAVQSNLAEVVEGEVSQLKETAAGRGLELTFDKPADFPVLYLDETKIRQVIMNFTDNAIYYTPRGGHITVKLEDKGESIEFTVNDQGMGVPKSEQPHLFSKFYRAENARKARPDGTGLGLFMAKKVIVAQGGSIIFHSQEGKGSTFGFAFPKAKLQLPPAEQPQQLPEPENG
jgi:signal transduction histidine kinase